jgi:hypothetical protein
VVVSPFSSYIRHGPSPVYYRPDTNEFYLNPVMFFDTVTREILADFDTYESVGVGRYYLASVVGDSTAVPGSVPTINMRLLSGPARQGG